MSCMEGRVDYTHFRRHGLQPRQDVKLKPAPRVASILG